MPEKKAPEGDGFGQLTIRAVCKQLGIKGNGKTIVFVGRREGCPKCEPALDLLRERVSLGGPEVVQRLQIKTIMVEDFPMLAASLGVVETPGMIFFRNRHVLARFDGILPTASGIDAALGRVLEPPGPTKIRKCIAPCDPPCDKPVHAGGLCMAHYSRQWSGLPIDKPIGRMGSPVLGSRKTHPRGTCQAPCDPPCDKPARASGLCVGHYQRQRRGQPINEPLTDPHKMSPDRAAHVTVTRAMNELGRTLGVSPRKIRSALKSIIATQDEQQVPTT